MKKRSLRLIFKEDDPFYPLFRIFKNDLERRVGPVSDSYAIKTALMLTLKAYLSETSNDNLEMASEKELDSRSLGKSDREEGKVGD